MQLLDYSKRITKREKYIVMKWALLAKHGLISNKVKFFLIVALVSKKHI